MRNYQKKCHRRRITAVFFLCLGAVALALFCNFHQKTTMWEQPPGALEGTMPSSQTTISLQRSDGTVEELGLEDYLVGVLAAEVSPDFQEEALKAQAVAARTYTEAKLQAGYPLCDDYRCCQAYYDEAQRRERWQEDFSAKESRLSQAVTETQGMVLCYEGALAKTYFHSTCGGKTASAEEVWGEAYPYLVSVDCSWDTDAPRYQETIELSPQEATAKLNDGVLRCTASPGEVPVVQSQTDSGRAAKVSYGGTLWDGTEFRQKLGLNSTNVSFELHDGILSISTVGYGHGVGLCQHGANGMAKEGYSFEEILSHYYPGCVLTVLESGKR